MAEYEFVDGRFTQVHARSMALTQDNEVDAAVPVFDPLVDVDVPPLGPHFDDLLLDKEGWRLWAESWDVNE